jgi:hypothetical protein
MPDVLRVASSWVSGASAGTATRRLRQISAKTSTGSNSAPMTIAKLSTRTLSLPRDVVPVVPVVPSD